MKDKLIKELSDGGIKIGACEKGIAELDAATSDCATLSGLFFKNAHFCLNEGFPTAGWIIDHFGDEAANFGIFCGKDGVVSNPRWVAVLGNVHVSADYGGYSVGKIYAKAKSTMDVRISDHARVMIDAFDDSCIHVRASGNSRVYVTKYGNAVVRIDKTDDAESVYNVKPTNKY